MPLYRRYLLKNTAVYFGGFLLGFFLLFLMIDYALNSQILLKSGPPLGSVALYYLAQFCKRLDLLMPLSLMIATMKVLLELNKNRELLALRAAGISINQITRPLLYLASCALVISYFNNEVILPRSLNYCDSFNFQFLKKKDKQSNHLSNIQLEDGSHLIFQKYNTLNHCYENAIWLKSSDDLWRIKRLNLEGTKATAYFAEYFARDENQKLIKASSHKEIIFDAFQLPDNVTRKGYIAVESASISRLFTLLRHHQTMYFNAEVMTYLLYKLCIPWLSPFIVMLIIPFCINYSRFDAKIGLYALAIVSLTGYCALLDALVILGKNQRIPPLFAIGVPFAITAGLAIRNTLRRA